MVPTRRPFSTPLKAMNSSIDDLYKFGTIIMMSRNLRGGNMADISLSLNSSLVTKLFDAVPYPWRKQIDGERMRHGNDEPVDVEFGGMESGGGDASDAEEYLDELIEAYIENVSEPRSGNSHEQALHDLLAPYAAPDRSSAEIKRALFEDAGSGDKLATFFSALRGGVFIDWIEVELSQRPNSSLGNPLSLSNLRIAVRAKVKLCARIFGKERCIKITSNWFRFEGERVEVELIVEALTVKARARARNIDFTIEVKIGPFKFKFRIGITTHVNRYLAKNSPVLADLSGVVINIPGLDLEYALGSVAIPASSSETTVLIDGSFS
jgi:hypothetical protein